MAQAPEETIIDQLVKLITALADPYLAIIVLSLVILLIFILLVISPPLRDAVSRLRFRRKVGDRELVIGPSEVPTPFIADIDHAAAKPVMADTENDTTNLIHDDEPTAQLDIDLLDERQLFRKMFIAQFVNRDIAEVEDAYEKLKALENREMTDEALETARVRFRLNLGDSLAEVMLKNLETDNPNWTEPSLRLAEFYISLASYNIAEQHISTGLDRAPAQSRLVEFKKLHADVRLSRDQHNVAISELEALLNDVDEPQLKTEILDKLSDLHQKCGNDFLAALALERALIVDPGTMDRRLTLAFEYCGKEETSLLGYYHYSLLRIQDRRLPRVLNNLGVFFRDLGLLGEMVKCWEVASTFDQPYPAANLATRLINAGFYQKAQEYLDTLPTEQKLIALPANTAKFLYQKKAEEEDKIEQLKSAANIHHRFVV